MKRVRAIGIALGVYGAVVWGGCAGAPTPAAPTPGAGAAGESRAAVLPPPPMAPSYVRALARDTRSEAGRPGARYWQQKVSYQIDAELDPGTSRLQGEEVVVYRNQSPDTLGQLVFHLYQNLFSEGVDRTRRVPITGGMTVERVAVGEREARRIDVGSGVPGAASYRVDGTLMYLRLPRPLAPGDSVAVTVGWHFQVPPEGAPRTGRIGREVYNVAQWYPQVAVYDDVRGWHTGPYLGNGEFYLEYGDFDVSLTLPEGWLVAATGELANGEEVLPARVRERLALALSRDSVVHVVTADDFGAGHATEQAPGGQLTWRFTAKDVRDFAFATSNRYLWDATRAVVPDPDKPKQKKVVAVHAFYRPKAQAWREAARYTKHALTFHAERWHPYIYSHITSVEGPIGGMEYPMLVFVKAFTDAQSLYGTIDHEVAHQWWPMMVGSKEPVFAWQDEGLATYIENLAAEDFFQGADAFRGDLDRYLAFAGTDEETPLMREADLFPSYPSFVVAAYSKPAVLLRALGAIIGDDTLHEALREYARRWKLKHPYAHDFFHTVESVAGRKLDWFWTPWWYGTGVFDQGIAGVTTEATGAGERVAVTVEDKGDNRLPTLLAVTLANGEVRRFTIPVEVWLAGARRHTATFEVPGQVTKVTLDPDGRFPDVDRKDDVWERMVVGAGN